MSTSTSLPLSRAASDVVVRPPHDTIVAAFERAARDGAPFVTMHGPKGRADRAAKEALERAWRWGKLLASRGVVRGDRVPILLPSSHAFVEAMLGAMLVGAIPVPLATPMTFGSADRYVQNLAAIVEDAGATAIVTYPRIRDAVALDTKLTALLRQVITEVDLEGLGPISTTAPAIGGADVAFLQYTSGTTGKPKGVVVSHRALVANAFAIAHGLGLDPSKDVGVSWLPPFHDMGLIGVLLTSICHPYPVHVMPPETFVMSPKRWLELLADVGGTLSASPNFGYDLCVTRGAEPREGQTLARWRVALNGAEPVHASTARRFHARYEARGFRGDAMMPVYGMAEATLAITFPSLERKLETLAVDRASLEQHGCARSAEGEGAHAAVSVGHPVAGTAIEIADAHGTVVAERTVGEIRVASASLMDGYFRDDAASADALSGGWLRTGDLGFVDGGRLFVTGRAKEMIIKAGRNYYPYDVERIAGAVDGVRLGGVAAFGRANLETGTEDLVVVAETPHGDAARRDDIAKAVRSELLATLGLKPDDVRVCAVGTLPRTTSGKIRRAECARLFTARGGA